MARAGEVGILRSFSLVCGSGVWQAPKKDKKAAKKAKKLPTKKALDATVASLEGAAEERKLVR